MDDSTVRAQLEHLARILDADITEIDRFECLGLPQLRELTDRIARRLFADQTEMFGRISALAPLLPAALIATLAQQAIPPLVAGRGAGAVGLAHPQKAAAVIRRLRPDYMADAAPHLDPLAVQILAPSIPTDALLPVAIELLRRHDHDTAGRLIEHLPANHVRYLVAHLTDDEGILRSAALARSDAQLNSLVRTIPRHRMIELLDTGMNGGDDLQVVLLSILNRLDPDLRTAYSAGSRAAALPPHNGFLCEDR
ncbi:hypothetical protein [Nocardia concava]|uniref:hypothetical protein n=1 Tax=Nocardia concava TaxID=257281 RepID=UPI00030A348B|nr:hypothetical protein [Nocardia concava]